MRDHIKAILNATIGIDEDCRASFVTGKEAAVERLFELFQSSSVGSTSPLISPRDKEIEESAWGYQISGVGGRLILVQEATRTDLVYAIKEQVDFLENLGILGERATREVYLWRSGKRPSELGDLQDQEPM